MRSFNGQRALEMDYYHGVWDVFFWGWMEESFITLPKSVALHSTGVTTNSIEFKITNTLLL